MFYTSLYDVPAKFPQFTFLSLFFFSGVKFILTKITN